MQQGPGLWVPAPPTGFPATQGEEAELENPENGELDVGRIGVSPLGPLRTHIHSPTKKKKNI